MTATPGDLPPLFGDLPELVTTISPPAAGLMTVLDLPPVAKLNDAEHVANHNKLRAALIALNDGKAEKTTGVWLSWTPQLVGTGWSLGNGKAEGWYRILADVCIMHAVVTFGTTTVFGKGQLQLTLPVTPAAVLPDGIANGASSNAVFVTATETLLVNLAIYDLAKLTASLIGPTDTGHMGLDPVTGDGPITWKAGDAWKIPDFQYLTVAATFDERNTTK